MHHSKETNAGQVGLEKHLQTSLNGIERKAKYKKDHKFENLYKLLNKWNLGQSWQYINKRAAKDAVKHLSKELNLGKYGYIVEADIKGYFENINHDILLKMLAHDIADKPFIKLIEKWLKAGIMTEENIIEKPYKGTPQGGVVSPILSNIYLYYILDMWFERIVKTHVEGESMMIAYADDFVCAFRYKRDADRFMIALEKRFGKFGLELAKDKTKLIKFSGLAKI